MENLKNNSKASPFWNQSRQKWAWIFYDWANSSFATTVMAGFFPLFFKSYWSQGSAQESTFLLGLTNSVASVVLVLTAPLLGALADQSYRRKEFLIFFALLGSFATGGLYFLQQQQQILALVCYGFGAVGFLCGNIFYDSLLPDVAEPEHFDQTSGLGYAWGYLGGAILFTVQVYAFLKWESLGFQSAAQVIQIAFLTVAVWWILFSIPLFSSPVGLVAQKSKVKPLSLKVAILEVITTFKKIKRTPKIFWFLIAFLFYYDGVNTIIKMAVDYGMALGFEPKDLITALLITNFVGFPAAIFYGYLGEKIGPLKGLKIAIIAYIAVAAWGSFLKTSTEFYILAGVIGLFQGGIQALSRSYFARMIPKDKSAEYFGFFNLLGKFSSVLGPVLMGAVALVSGSHRASMAVVVLFFVIGYTLLNKHAKYQEIG
jgi:UMF1 family MFS transporter